MSLQLKNVSKQFGEFTAVEDLSLKIPKGEMFGLLGANGAGKTTTFRMILGLISKTSGSITWDDHPINYEASNIIGYLPEERGLYPKLKVREQLIYLGRLRGMNKQLINREIKEWLIRFKILEYENKRIEDLSKGNQQKIQFIASVIHKPKLLILDEPFSGLDPVNVELLKDSVLELKNNGTSIVFSSHRMEHVEELCEYLCIMHHGKPVVHGKLSDIKHSFGKKNITIKADFDISFLQQTEGVIKSREHAWGMVLQVENEEVSQVLFAKLQGRGFVRKFELEEPSLNDIFIEKVGASYHE